MVRPYGVARLANGGFMAVKVNHPDQMEIFAVPSPCIGVCQAGPKGYCLGCYRTRDERFHWLQINDAARRTVIKACQKRKAMALRQQQPEDGGQATVEEPQQQSLFSDNGKQ